MIGTLALVRALLARSLGPGRGGLLAAAAASAGLLAALVAHRYLVTPESGRPDLLAPLFQRYPSSLRYAVGLAFAFRALAQAGEDQRSGWTQQLVAAGAARDRYLAALALSAACAAWLVWLLSAGTWACTLALLGHGSAPAVLFLELLALALLWQVAAAAFAAAALAVAVHAGAAQGLMITALLLPWLVAFALRELVENGPPLWLRALFWLAPPYAPRLGIRPVSLLVLYTGMAGLLAWLRAHRLLRVR